MTTANERNAWVVYWHQNVSSLTWMNEEDQQQWRAEMNVIRTHIQAGHVTAITAGETLTVQGNVFYPMHVNFQGKMLAVHNASSTWPYGRHRLHPLPVHERKEPQQRRSVHQHAALITP